MSPDCKRWIKAVFIGNHATLLVFERIRQFQFCFNYQWNNQLSKNIVHISIFWHVLSLAEKRTSPAKCCCDTQQFHLRLTAWSFQHHGSRQFRQAGLNSVKHVLRVSDAHFLLIQRANAKQSKCSCNLPPHFPSVKAIWWVAFSSIY